MMENEEEVDMNDSDTGTSPQNQNEEGDEAVVGAGSAPRKRKSYPIEQRLAVVRRIKNGETYSTVSKETGIDRHSIRYWVSIDQQMMAVPKKRKTRAIGSGRKAQFPALEARLFAWYNAERAKNLCISYKMLQTAVSSFTDLALPSTFKCSLNYIACFCRRSGTLDSTIAKKWIETVFTARGPYLSSTKSLLIWDSYGSHMREDVVAHLKQKCRSDMLLIPPKTTYYFQPLDVAVNAGFKAALKNEWDAWIRDGPNEMTPKGYRKRPSYQAVIDMVSAALDSISSANIKRAFECCGIAPMGQKVDAELLNQRLKTVISWQNQEGVLPAEEEEIDQGNSDGEEEIVPAAEDDADAQQSDGPLSENEDDYYSDDYD